MVGLISQKTGIIFKVEEFRTTPLIQQCFICQGFEHKAPNCTKKQKCGVCGEVHSHKSCPNTEERSPKCANCRGPHVANYKGCPAYKDQSFRQHVVQNQVSYASILKQASPPPPNNTFNSTPPNPQKTLAYVPNASLLQYYHHNRTRPHLPNHHHGHHLHTTNLPTRVLVNTPVG